MYLSHIDQLASDINYYSTSSAWFFSPVLRINANIKQVRAALVCLADNQIELFVVGGGNSSLTDDTDRAPDRVSTTMKVSDALSRIIF
nr:unnamed protein product [Spirometra erinaceieuropaei]